MIVGFLFKYKLLNRTYRLKYHREMRFISELRVIFVMFLWGIQSTRMNHHFAKWLIIRYSNKSPIFIKKSFPYELVNATLEYLKLNLRDNVPSQIPIDVPDKGDYRFHLDVDNDDSQ